MRFAICNEMFQGWDLGSVFRLVAEVGYDAVELAPYTLAPSIFDLPVERRREIARSASACGLQIAGLHWLLVGPSGLHISHPDPEVRARTVTYLTELVNACADLGGKILVFGSPKQRDVLPGLGHAEASRLALETFSACARAAEIAGVTFCLEALPLEYTNFMTTTAEVVGLVRAIGSPNLRMVLDVKSMCSELAPPGELIQMAAPYLAHFHANDANLRGPGFGTTDFVPIFQALREVGYTGYISVEVFDYSLDPAVVARESLRYIRESAGDRGQAQPRHHRPV
ncbi:MAG: sugar phosphate isomerase/epimerase [Chloroflexi bacterium]|nr:sugar phosphate isomerase/epimerase [Chloroflexota bacterium]